MWPCTHESSQPCGVNYIYVGIHAITMTGQEYGLTQYIKDASHLRRFIVRSAETLPNPAKIRRTNLHHPFHVPHLLYVAQPRDYWWQGMILDGRGGGVEANEKTQLALPKKPESFKVSKLKLKSLKIESQKVRCKVENRCWHHQGHFCSS